jgi:hypothetical protein
MRDVLFSLQPTVRLDVAAPEQALSYWTPCVIPSVVRLQPFNRCALTPSQVFDQVGIARYEHSSPALHGPVEDGKAGPLGNVVRNPSSVAADVELEAEVVERGPEIVNTVAEDKRPGGIEWLDFANVKAILQSFAVSFDSDGAQLAIHPPRGVRL